MGDSAFRIELDGRDGAWVIGLCGELDLSTVNTVNGLFDNIAWEAQPSVTIDLRGLRFMDSEGVEALLRAREQAEAAGTPFRVIPGDGVVWRVFEVSGLTEAFDWAEPSMPAA